jgi:ABC-type phosphate transport system ATPase subunit
MIDKVNDLITEISNKKGIIITDHNYENVIKVSAKLALMKEGKLHHLKHKNDLVEKGYLKVGMI